MLKVSNLAGFGKRVSTEDANADAQAFLTAAGISDPNIVSAVEQLVIDLKAAGIWAKMLAIYPFVGGSAAAHKWNLKDPQDTDAAFRIAWSGTLTHNANGVVSNGSSGYGDTKLIPSVDMQTNGGSMGVWLNDFVGANQVAIGCETTNPSQSTFIAPQWTSPSNTYVSMSGAQATFTYAGTGVTLIQIVRTDATNCFYQQTNTRTSFTGAFSAPTHSIFVAARNNAGTPALYYSNTPIQFAYIGDTLSTTETDDYYTAVNAFQGTLGR
mgnify:CR=1 FL=1